MPTSRNRYRSQKGRKVLRKTKPVMDRIMARVVVNDNGCWIWQGATTNGYGIVGLGRRQDGTRNTHRVTYEHKNGPVPAGLVLDHLCRTPRCCNPDHLEAVTQQVNVDRGIRHKGSKQSHCRKGHPLTDENTVTESGHRACRICYEVRKARKRIDNPAPPPTHCNRGHEFTSENTYQAKTQRCCRECRKRWRADYDARKKTRGGRVRDPLTAPITERKAA